MITVAGEALIDVIVDRSGTLAAHPGGGPFNVARTVARLGQPCRFLGRVGGDAFGRRLRAALDERGIGLAVPKPTAVPTTLAVAEVDADGVADYRFYLEGTSAGELTRADVPVGVFDDTAVIAFGGLGLVAEPMSSTLRAVLGDARPATTVLLDPNCRPRAIANLTHFRGIVEACLERSDIVKVSVDDLAVLDPGSDVRSAARRLLDFHPSAVLVTDGGRPVTIHTARGERPVPVPVVTIADTVGAGDAFVAGLITWWAEHGCERSQAGDLELLEQAARAAVTVSAAVCTAAGANLPDTFTWLPAPSAGPR